MNLLTTIVLSFIGGALGSSLYKKAMAFHARWLQVEQAVFAHDQAILQIALKTKTAICTCGEPDCPANLPEAPVAEGHYL
jgi:uncharacterized low-complexity protein